MINRVLACEIRRSKSRNINGTVARQMREYLIKLYCSIGKIQKQKENTEAEKLKKQMEDMRINILPYKKKIRTLGKNLRWLKEELTYLQLQRLKEIFLRTRIQVKLGSIEGRVTVVEKGYQEKKFSTHGDLFRTKK